MSNEFLGDRRRALEDHFFEKQSEHLIEEIRLKRETEEASARLERVSAIMDRAVLERLVELGITPDSLAALALIPLVAVAWADGRVQAAERHSVLEAAEAEGVKIDTVAHLLLESWLENRPGPELVGAWKAYVRALAEHLDVASYGALKNDVLGRARAVAKSSGGLLGLASISSEESAMLDELEQAFG